MSLLLENKSGKTIEAEMQIKFEIFPPNDGLPFDIDDLEFYLIPPSCQCDEEGGIICDNCHEFDPINEHILAVGYQSFIGKDILSKIKEDSILTLTGNMCWEVRYYDHTGEYDDFSKFQISNFIIEERLL